MAREPLNFIEVLSCTHGTPMSFCYARLREIRSYNAEGRLHLKELTI